MRAVAQRVSEARVVVENEVVGEIGRGLLVYLGAARGDTDADLGYVLRKVRGLRVFPDDDGRMSRDVGEVDGGILVIPQFTLFGDMRRGRRPSFDGAEAPEIARERFHSFVGALRETEVRVECGIFQADMQVHGIVDGPVTILIDSTKLF